jgi:hypothetical protein
VLSFVSLSTICQIEIRLPTNKTTRELTVKELSNNKFSNNELSFKNLIESFIVLHFCAKILSNLIFHLFSFSFNQNTNRNRLLLAFTRIGSHLIFSFSILLALPQVAFHEEISEQESENNEIHYLDIEEVAAITFRHHRCDTVD